VALPSQFTQFGVAPTNPYTLAPDEITANREAWVDEWTQIVVR
jgi:thiamine transport system substrate-binding protein